MTAATAGHLYRSAWFFLVFLSLSESCKTQKIHVKYAEAFSPAALAFTTNTRPIKNVSSNLTCDFVL